MTVKFLVVGTESWNSIVIIKLQVFGVNSISFFFLKGKQKQVVHCFVLFFWCFVL